MRRHPRFLASTVLVPLVLGPMVTTALWPAAHAPLRRRFASSWHTLAHGQLWRLFTSTFVQSGHGFVAGIVALLAFVPLAEWRIGSTATAATFALGDWVSSTLVMCGARVLAALGSAPAQRVLVHLDSGASSACYACAAAFALSLPRGRWRAAIAVGLVLDLAVEGVVTHMLAEVQHTVAVLVGAAVGLIALRPREVV